MDKVTSEYVKKLKKDREKIDQLIRIIEADTPLDKPLRQKTEGIIEGAKIILREEGQPLSTREIFTRLKRRGMRTKATKPLESVAMMLYKDNKKKGDIKRVGRGQWYLTEHANIH